MRAARRPHASRFAVAAALALLAPASASAAPTPDRVLEEVATPLAVGIGGQIVAYTLKTSGGVQVVVRDGDRPVKRLQAGRGAGPVDVGRDRRRRRVVVFERCAGRCDLVAFLPSAVSTRVVVRGVRGVTDVAVDGGRVFWADGRRVRSRSLDGGATRREAVAGAFDPTELDTDGTTLAVTGADRSDPDLDDGGTSLSVTRVGSGRARLRGGTSYSQEYTAVRSPVVTRTGITALFDHFAAGVSTRFSDFLAGAGDMKARTTGGMGILTWAADGDRAVLVEAPSDVGCGLGSSFQSIDLGAAPCRIVLVSSLARERLLPPRIAINRRSATVARATVRGTMITGRRAQPHVAVVVRDGDTVLATLRTDAAGRVTLPDTSGVEGVVVEAATMPRSYAFAPTN